MMHPRASSHLPSGVDTDTPCLSTANSIEFWILPRDHEDLQPQTWET